MTEAKTDAKSLNEREQEGTNKMHFTRCRGAPLTL